jgi:hypothetical protein
MFYVLFITFMENLKPFIYLFVVLFIVNIIKIIKYNSIMKSNSSGNTCLTL